jgi:hypothetical protein
MKLSTAIGLSAFLAAAFLTLGICAPDASATERPFYIKAEIGALPDTSVEGIELEDGTVYGASVGTTVGPFRVEAGVRSLNFDTFGINLSAVDYTATVYADIGTTGFFVGAGADYAQAEASFGYGDYNADAYGWHVAGGYQRRIAEGVILEGQARWTELDFDDFDGSGPSFTLGARFAL